MLKIRRPLGRLIFNMGIAIPGETVFLIETAPRWGLRCRMTEVCIRHTTILPTRALACLCPTIHKSSISFWSISEQFYISDNYNANIKSMITSIAMAVFKKTLKNIQTQRLEWSAQQRFEQHSITIPKGISNACTFQKVHSPFGLASEIRITMLVSIIFTKRKICSYECKYSFSPDLWMCIREVWDGLLNSNRIPVLASSGWLLEKIKWLDDCNGLKYHVGCHQSSRNSHSYETSFGKHICKTHFLSFLNANISQPLWHGIYSPKHSINFKLLSRIPSLIHALHFAWMRYFVTRLYYVHQHRGFVAT